MKSDLQLLPCALLSALILLANPAGAKEEPACEVSAAALTLPDDSDGLLHVRGADDPATRPLQLSKRYFSERMKVAGPVVQFFGHPVEAKPAAPPAEPLLALRLPEGAVHAFAVLWHETEAGQKPVWKGMIINGGDWEKGSLRVFNATAGPIGLRVGKRDILLEKGKSTDFTARDWPGPFPAKIYQLEPDQKNIFSSTWQVSEGSREACFVFRSANSVSLRSVLEVAPSPPPAP